MYSFLIVEDEAIVANDVRDLIEDLGYKVVGMAATAEEALKQTRKYKPDFVLMDIVLKGDEDGIEATYEINKAVPDTRVIYLTAHTDSATITRAGKSPHFAFLNKPFEPVQLQVAIGKTPEF